MRLKELTNAVEAVDFDINSDEHIAELGKAVAEKQVVFVDQKVDEDRLYDIHTQWGTPANGLVHTALIKGDLGGKHWRKTATNIFRTVMDIKYEHRMCIAAVTYQKDKRGKPKGVFANGDLGWHSDHPSTDDNMRVVGLAAVEHTEGSATWFLSTAEAYDKLSQEDKTMVDELRSVYNWEYDNFTGELIPDQKEIVRYNQVPMDGMSSALQMETAAGVKGIHFPGSLFSHFHGMSKEESKKFKDHLWTLINKDEYITKIDWKDGQVAFMDQMITLHARPTNIKDGNMRYMLRCCSYMDKLYPDYPPHPIITIGDKRMELEEFLDAVDTQKRHEYEQSGSYLAGSL